jgi:hypothetical protein
MLSSYRMFVRDKFRGIESTPLTLPARHPVRILARLGIARIGPQGCLELL